MFRTACVAKWTIRYCASRPLRTVSRLASKSRAASLPWRGATERIACASARENGNLASRAPLSPRRAEISLATAGLGVTRVSMASKTASAKTATVPGGGRRLAAALRNRDKTASEGRATIS